MMFLHPFIFFLVYVQIFINKTSGFISEEDEHWLSSVILESPERTQNPSQAEIIHTTPSTVNNQQPISTAKKRKKSNKRTAEGLERRKLQARMNKKRKKEQSAESLEAFKARQKEYSKKHFLKIRKDPLKNEKFKERHRIAAQKSYIKKKEQDPEGLAEYVRKKNQRFRNKKRLQKKTEDTN